MSVTTWLSVHDSVNLEKQQKNTTKLDKFTRKMTINLVCVVGMVSKRMR